PDHLAPFSKSKLRDLEKGARDEIPRTPLSLAPEIWYVGTGALSRSTPVCISPQEIATGSIIAQKRPIMVLAAQRSKMCVFLTGAPCSAPDQKCSWQTRQESRSDQPRTTERQRWLT